MNSNNERPAAGLDAALIRRGDSSSNSKDAHRKSASNFSYHDCRSHGRSASLKSNGSKTRKRTSEVKGTQNNNGKS